MSGLESLNTRLNYRGGNQQERMIEGKLASLKKALLYSYQAATAVLTDGREFKCLINPDKLKIDYEDKIISIPFEDVRVNSTDKSIETIGMKAGDVFTWKETNTTWLVYLQRLEERAYFRAEIRKCESTLKIGETEYPVFTRKKPLSEITWHTSKGTSWNSLDYVTELYITKTEETKKFFERFTKLTIANQPWEVQAVDALSTEGIIRVLLKEYYTNSIEQALEEEQNNKEDIIVDKDLPHIEGPTIVYPYDEVTYTIENAQGGSWTVSNAKAQIVNQTESEVLIAITTGRSGEFELTYKRIDEDDIIINVIIESL